jgi:thiol-disulfide isomerase/thioredoxin
MEIRKNDDAAPDTLNKLKMVAIEGSATEAPKLAFEQWLSQLKHSGLTEEEINRRHSDSLRVFIARHSASKASAYLLWDISSLKYMQVKGLIEMIDSSLSGTFEYKTAAGVIERLHNAQKMVVGEPFHDIILHDTAGRAIDSRQFRGKYLLVEFWASWCGPCMKSIPSLQAFYKKNKGPRFDILGVSWDYTADRWKNAIIKTRMPWPQVLDLQNTGAGLGNYYGLDAIPTNILVDPGGKVLGYDLSIDQIQQLLPPAEGHAGGSR